MLESFKSPFPQIYNEFKQAIEQNCATGKLNQAQALYDVMQEQRAKLPPGRNDDNVLLLMGAGASSLARAYAKAGELDKAKKIIQEMEDARDSSGSPVVNTNILRLMLEHRMW